MDFKTSHDDRLPGSGMTRHSGSSNEQRHSTTSRSSAVALGISVPPSDVTRHHQGEDTSFASFMSDTTPSGALAGVSSAGPRTSRNSHRNLHDEGDDRPSMPRRSEDAGARPPPPSFEEVVSNLQNDSSRPNSTRGGGSPAMGLAQRNDQADDDRSSFASVVSDTRAPSGGPTSVAYGSSGMRNAIDGGYKSSPTRLPVMNETFATAGNDNEDGLIGYAQRNEGRANDQSSFASVVSDTRAPSADSTSIAYGRSGMRNAIDGAYKPSPARLPVMNENVATAGSGNEDEPLSFADISPSFVDIENGRNEMRAASGNAAEGGGDEEAPPEILPGAVAVSGVGGPPPVSVDRSRSSAFQQHHGTDTVTRDPMVEARLVADDDRTLRYEQVEQRIQERVEQRIQEEMERMRSMQSAPVQAQVVATESMQARPNDPPTNENAGEASQAASQQRGETCNNPIKSRKRQVYLAVVLVLVITVVVLGVVLGRSNSSGLPDSSQSSSTGGPAPVSPAPSDAPVDQDNTPTPDPTSSPEPTHDPTPLPTPARTQDPTPPPTPPPTLTPVSPEQLKELIQSVSLDGGAALEDASSPQSRALLWLQGNRDLAQYPDWRKIQRYTLATFYYSTNGAGWFNNTGWLSDLHECDWHDFSCSSDDPCDGEQNRREICLIGDGLEGTLPPELALLSNSLEELLLNSNQLTGTILTELGLLRGMAKLWLDDNALTGTIPTALSNMTNLSQLWLDNNLITGTIPSEIGLLTKMTSLNLYKNNLSGPIPLTFESMIYLAILRLHDNALIGTIPTIFNSLTNLRQLTLYNNSFTGQYECPKFIQYCAISCNDGSDHTCRTL